MKRKPVSLTLTAAAAVETDTEARTITGLAVPYGPVGHSSAGAVTFARGSLTIPAQTGRIKLLEQHDTNRPLGYATELEETDEGLRATFEVPDGPRGDEALAMAADGRRDGLSVGVILDAETVEKIIEKWWSDDPDDEPVAASGELIEVSQVTIPAFADARVDGSAALAADLATGPMLTLAVTFDGTQTAPALAGATQEETMKCKHCGHVHAAGAECTTTASAAPVTLDSPPAQLEAAAPRPPAVAGAVAHTTDRPIYTFDGRGPSLVRDAYRARFSPFEHAEAVDRFTRFNRAMAAGDGRQVGYLAASMAAVVDRRQLRAAVETRTTAPNYIQEAYRPDMLVEVIDKGRPIVSRVGTVNLTDATPYRLPVEGEFSGVADHTEGTAHAPEGDLSLDDEMVTPGAISGAFRLTRELIDASNPALDQIAIRAMGRNYRRNTEAKANGALEAAKAPASVTAASTTVEDVSLAIDTFYDLNDEQPSQIFVGSTFYSTLRQDKDTTGRPMLARVGPANANGTILPGATGAEVDGVDLARAYSVDAAAAYALEYDALHLAESALSTFRFEEVEGPGVVKLALWAYFAAQVIRADGVARLATTVGG